jgi:hypothetical protein
MVGRWESSPARREFAGQRMLASGFNHLHHLSIAYRELQRLTRIFSLAGDSGGL